MDISVNDKVREDSSEQMVDSASWLGVLSEDGSWLLITRDPERCHDLKHILGLRHLNL